MTNKIYQSLCLEYVKYADANNLSEGQKLFLALHDADPVTASKITGNPDIDPFYKDDNIKQFMEWIREQDAQRK